jgi:hypothetical protein
MNDTRAQVADAITWFVGFLVVSFILILFIIFGGMSFALKTIGNERASLTVSGRDVFDRAEQQRDMSVLFAGDFRDQRVYDIIENYAFTTEKSGSDSGLFFSCYKEYLEGVYRLTGCSYFERIYFGENLLESSNNLNYGASMSSDSIYSNLWKERYRLVQQSFFDKCGLVGGQR